MVWWAVSIDAEPFGIGGRPFLPRDDAIVRSPQLVRSREGRGCVGLRCSVKAEDGAAAVEGALAFYERSTGEPLGKVLRTVVWLEGT